MVVKPSELDTSVLKQILTEAHARIGGGLTLQKAVQEAVNKFYPVSKIERENQTGGYKTAQRFYTKALGMLKKEVRDEHAVETNRIREGALEHARIIENPEEDDHERLEDTIAELRGDHR